MSTSPEDWRIANAEHLKGQHLHFRKYTRWSDTWDHDHCAACWAKFAEGEEPDIPHEGYATGDFIIDEADPLSPSRFRRSSR
jgi:hypothetical protein